MVNEIHKLASVKNSHLHVVFSIVATASLFLVVFVLWKEATADWRAVQEEYTRWTSLRTQLPGGEPVKPGIRQVYLPKLDRTDRCQSCHLGVEDAAKAAPEPFSLHPGDFLENHPPERFGCTVCHGGQGIATTYRAAAHTPIAHWEEPMLPRGLIEANCGQCHLGVQLNGAPWLSEGRGLLESEGCAACHEIPGVIRNQDFAPSLDGIGTKVNLPWLKSWLADPESYLDYPRMPKFRLNEEQIEALVAFLWKHTSSPAPSAEAFTLENGDYDRGLARFRESRCVSCHSVEGRGGRTAPELSRVADKIRPDWLYGFIRNPHSYYPHTQMLQYNFSDQDVLDIVAYLTEEFTENGLENEPEPPTAPDPSLEEQGEALYAKMGCRGCHEIGDVPFEGKIGPDLSHVSSADIETVDFPDTSDASRTVPNWLFLKVRAPGAVGQDPKMPSFGFPDRKAAALTVALMSLREKTVPHEMVIQEPPTRVFNPQGEFGRIFKKYRCLTCHQVFGYGGTLSTAPLEAEGSKVNRNWLFEYLRVPYAIRPTVEERMPRFRMSESEARVLAQYISSVLVDDSIIELGSEELSDEQASRGKELFQEKGCRGCHIVGNTGGYVGPQLNNTGERLKPGWIVSWLMAPLYYKPNTVHPDYGFSFEEAKTLAAYLGTMKEQ